MVELVNEKVWIYEEEGTLRIYILCPACSERMYISKISFTINAEARLCDRMESDDESIWCPQCREIFKISIPVYFSDLMTITPTGYFCP